MGRGRDSGLSSRGCKAPCTLQARSGVEESPALLGRSVYLFIIPLVETEGPLGCLGTGSLAGLGVVHTS